MRILVTGGAGYIGSRLTELLVARDEGFFPIPTNPPFSAYGARTREGAVA